MNQTESAFKSVQENEAYIVDVLRRVIAIDTSVPPGPRRRRIRAY